MIFILINVTGYILTAVFQRMVSTVYMLGRKLQNIRELAVKIFIVKQEMKKITKAFLED